MKRERKIDVSKIDTHIILKRRQGRKTTEWGSELKRVRRVQVMVIIH